VWFQMHLPHTVQKGTLKINVSPFLIQIMSFALLQRKSKVLHSCIGYLERVTEQMHQNCFDICIFPNLFFTLYFTGHQETETKFQKLMALPAVHTIVFDNVEWKSEVKIQPHRGCFLNSLDICITNMARWTVTCCMQCEVWLAIQQIHKISG